ncbi:hypothetical protein CAEBREN_15955 [Caenorhabditis brenneri]|uniref:NR LBD domain-containing protein n=1 Tax=Caenorhabditis brenneri TaxID=135651 RepID=G0M9H7_CAEBE|nr:hypothetical protein CAEBREN_15955 [Caenorhabditis brenneri]
MICCEPDKKSHIKTIIDVSHLISKAAKILESDSTCLTPYKSANSLERLAFGMERVKSEKAGKNLSIVGWIGKEESLFFWEQNFILVAQWFRQFSEFTELPMDVKMEILQSAWVVWLRLERLAETVEYQKKHVLGKNVFAFAEGSCMNIEELEVDVSWCTNYSFGQIKALMVPDINNFWRHPVEVLFKLYPTNTELNFMLIQLCLSDAQKKVSLEIRDVIEKLLDIQANNLHDYYIRKMKNPHYSGRLAKMMKVVQLLEADARSQREKVRLAKVFDVFSFEFSHPEMFEIF